MNFFKRAIKNVTRKKSKSILLILTFFLIGNLVIIGLGVSSASESAKSLTRQKMRAVVTYSLDYDAIWKYADSIEDEDERNEFYNHYPQINLDDVNALLKDERVKTANAISSRMWYQDEEKSLDFVHLGNEAEANLDLNNGTSCYIDETGEQICEIYRNPMFFVKTNMFPSMIEIEDGNYEVIEGRFYNENEIKEAAPVCLITKALAETNGLTVGDTIALAVDYGSSYYQKMGLTNEDFEVSFEIIGIYTYDTPILPGTSNFDYCYPYENPDNMILMPSTSSFMASLPMQQKAFDYQATLWPDDEYYTNEDNRPSEEKMLESLYIDNVTLLLSDPLDVDAFVEDYKESLPQFAKLDANNEQFNNLAKPLDTLSMYANFIVWLVVINAIVIITLVTALTLKTREYEIGVLLSIGASKLKIIGQFFIELALVAIIGFSLSIVSGSLISKQIGNKVLEYQISSSGLNEDEEEPYMYDYIDIWNTDYSTEITLDDLISEYEVSVSPVIIAEIYVLGLGIVFISVIIPSFMIMRFNPKKILMNQN